MRSRRLVTLAVGAAVLSATPGQAAPPATGRAWPPPAAIDAGRVARFGLRVLRGPAVAVVTDLPPSEDVDSLPRVVEAALPVLRRYFGVAADPAWRVRACVIGDRARFHAAGLMPPAEHAAFPHGMSLGYRLWVNDQPTAYYRRALLLHELTHSFMSTRLGGTGPGWYAEAMAELMAGHRWEEATGRLRMGLVPARKRDAPMWGRVRVLRQARTPLAAGAVMAIDNRRAMSVEAYARVWALAKLLDTHPRYQARWRELPQAAPRSDFDRRFRAAFADDWRLLNTELALFAATCEYGHDIRREAIPFADGKPLAPGAAHRVPVRADRGWQPAGVAVRRGLPYAYQAEGRFVIATDPIDRQRGDATDRSAEAAAGARAGGQPWRCEAGGVTLRYHAGQPLGRLMAAVYPTQHDHGAGFLRPFPLGAAGVFRSPASGTLYLRLNDSPAELAENRGGVHVLLEGVGREEE